MKGKIWTEFKNMAEAELHVKLKETQEELFLLKFKHSSTPLKNALKIRNLRRLVAKLKTLLKEKTKSQ